MFFFCIEWTKLGLKCNGPKRARAIFCRILQKFILPKNRLRIRGVLSHHCGEIRKVVYERLPKYSTFRRCNPKVLQYNNSGTTSERSALELAIKRNRMDIWKIMSECVELTDEEKLEQLFTMLTMEGIMEKNKPCTEFKQLLMSPLPVELVTLFMLGIVLATILYTRISDSNLAFFGHPDMKKLFYASVWQKLRKRAHRFCRKVWTQEKILSPNVRYFVAILRFVAIYAVYKADIELCKYTQKLRFLL